MLALDDARWMLLQDAHGPAVHVPGMLRALARGDDDGAQSATDGVWNRLCSALCHQGTTYGASYAAVPHVVEIGAARPRAEQPMFWAFVGAIAGATDAAPVPPDLAAAYRQALVRAEAAAVACINPGLEDGEALALLTAVAGLRGQRLLMHALDGLADEELQQECPDCGTELYVTVATPPYVTADQDPVGDKPARTAPVSPTTAPSPDVHAAAALVRRAGLADLAARVAALDGVVLCPACGDRFPLVS